MNPQPGHLRHVPEGQLVQLRHVTPELPEAAYYYVFTVIIDDPDNPLSVKQKTGTMNASGGQTASVVFNL